MYSTQQINESPIYQEIKPPHDKPFIKICIFDFCKKKLYQKFNHQLKKVNLAPLFLFFLLIKINKKFIKARFIAMNHASL